MPDSSGYFTPRREVSFFYALCTESCRYGKSIFPHSRPFHWKGLPSAARRGSLAFIEHPPSLISSSRAQPSIFLARRYASHWRFYGNDALVLPVSAFSRASFIGLPEGFLDFAQNDDTQKTASPYSSPFLWKGLPSVARRGWHSRLLKYVFPYFASAPWMP